MINEVNTTFSFSLFRSAIENLIDLAKKEHHLALAFGGDINDSRVDYYVDLLANIIPVNCEKYNEAFFDWWRTKQEMVGCAITTYIFGVVDYTGSGEPSTPLNHDLLSIECASDPYGYNDTKYTVSIDSIETLWQICLGEIPVRERFS